MQPKKKRGQHFAGKRKPRESYDDIVKENELLEKYYKVKYLNSFLLLLLLFVCSLQIYLGFFIKAQNIVPEQEWENFMMSMRSGLPSTFRITGIRG